MAMIDDDDDDLAINEISNNMKLPIYAVLVGRVSFLHTLIVVSCFSSVFFVFFWSMVFCFMLSSFFSFGVKSMRTVQIKKREHS